MLRKNEYIPAETILLGTILSKSFKEAGISRRLAADYLQCSEDTIDNWCSGRARITPGRLNSLCSLLATKGRLSTNRVREVYVKALESYGFATTWPPGGETIDQATLCLSGSLMHRKELLSLEIISDYLSRLNRKVFIFHCGNSIKVVLSYLNLIDVLGVSNLVICGMSLPAEIYKLMLDEAIKHRIVVALIATDCPRELVLSYKNALAVTWSNAEIAYRATEILIKAGHTRIGTVRLTTREARFDGYCQALKDNGIEFDPELVAHHAAENIFVNYQSIADEKLMNRLEHFVMWKDMTAFFAPSELITLAVPFFLTKNGKRLFYDMSICGLAYPGWIGQGLNLDLTYLSYPIEEVTHRILDGLVHFSIANDLPPELRYVEVTKLAKRIDNGIGSIRVIDRAGQSVGSDAPRQLR